MYPKERVAGAESKRKETIGVSGGDHRYCERHKSLNAGSVCRCAPRERYVLCESTQTMKTQ
jgi:hypothetical protein